MVEYDLIEASTTGEMAVLELHGYNTRDDVVNAAIQARVDAMVRDRNQSVGRVSNQYEFSVPVVEDRGSGVYRVAVLAEPLQPASPPQYGGPRRSGR